MMKKITVKTKYHNDLHNSYMILYGKDNVLDYQIHMILNNSIPNLLKLNYEFFDNELRYYYDITNKQTLEEYISKWKINYNFLFQFLKSLSMVTSELKSYLVNSNHLLLNPKFIFFEESKNKFYFCYYKDFDENITTSLHELSEIFMEHEIEDEKGSFLVKELYHKSSDRKFSIDNILDLATGKYYEKHNNSLELKKSMDGIYSRLYEKETVVEEVDVNTSSGIKAKIRSIKTWFNDVNNKLLNRSSSD